MKKTVLRYLANIFIAGMSVLLMLGKVELASRYTRHKNLLLPTQVEPLRNYLKADPAKGCDIREKVPGSPAAVDGLNYEI